MNYFAASQIKNPKFYKTLERYRFFSDVTFEFLPESTGMKLIEEATHLCIKKNEGLYQENETPQGIYILLKGKVKIYQTDKDGMLKVLFIYTKGDLFGYQSILSMPKHHTSASALEDCEYLFIPENVFKNLVSQSVEFSNLLLKSLSSEYNVMLNRFGIFTQNSIKERLALALLLLNEKFQTAYQLTGETEIKISRGDLAAFVGTSLENLVRTIKSFKEEELIRTDGKSIYITNFDSLYELTGLQ